MDASVSPVAAIVLESPHAGRKTIYAAVLLLIIVAALITYKSSAALGVIQRVQSTGAFQPRTNVVPLPNNSLQLNALSRSINYFLVIWPALLFGILISGAVRVLDNEPGPRLLPVEHEQVPRRGRPHGVGHAHLPGRHDRAEQKQDEGGAGGEHRPGVQPARGRRFFEVCGAGCQSESLLVVGEAHGPPPVGLGLIAFAFQSVRVH